MVIRSEQFSALEQAHRQSYVVSNAARLRRDFPEELRQRGIDSPQLEVLVRQAIADAAQYGVDAGEDLRLYLDCIALLGPGFDRAVGWAARILGRDDVDGGQKMGEINDYLIFGLEERK